MFDQIIEKLPELQKLETTVGGLEREHAQATARVQSLGLKVQQAREDDLNREALALNSGRKVPNPTEGHLASQLEGAQRDLQVLERRQALAVADRGRYISEHHAEILSLLSQAHGEHGERVAAAATVALEALTAYHGAEDAARNLQRLHPAPQPENTSGPESTSVVWGALTTRNYAGGPARGDLEGTLQYLVSLGRPTIVEAVEDEEDVA